MSRSVRVPEGVYRFIKEYAKKHGISLTEAIALLVMR